MKFILLVLLVQQAALIYGQETTTKGEPAVTTANNPDGLGKVLETAKGSQNISLEAKSVTKDEDRGKRNFGGFNPYSGQVYGALQPESSAYSTLGLASMPYMPISGRADLSSLLDAEAEEEVQGTASDFEADVAEINLLHDVEGNDEFLAENNLNEDDLSHQGEVHHGDICGLPKIVGPCRARLKRYYFDTATGQCTKFSFGGCRGNRNNFRKLRDCQAACEGSTSTIGQQHEAAEIHDEIEGLPAEQGVEEKRSVSADGQCHSEHENCVTDAIVQCNTGSMDVALRFAKTFNGKIYLWHQYETCVLYSAEGESRETSSVSFSLTPQTCVSYPGYQAENSDSAGLHAEGRMRRFQIMVQFDPHFVSFADVNFVAACEMDISEQDLEGHEKKINFEYTIQDASPVFLTGSQTAPPTLKKSTFEVTIHRGDSADSPLVQGPVALGELLTVQIQVKSDNPHVASNVAACFAVEGVPQAMEFVEAYKDSQAPSGKVKLIENGCSMMPNVMSNFKEEKFEVDGQTSIILTGHMKAMRFPMSDTVSIKCKVNLCLSSCAEAQACQPIHLSKFTGMAIRMGGLFGEESAGGAKSIQDADLTDIEDTFNKIEDLNRQGGITRPSGGRRIEGGSRRMPRPIGRIRPGRTRTPGGRRRPPGRPGKPIPRQRPGKRVPGIPRRLIKRKFPGLGRPPVRPVMRPSCACGMLRAGIPCEVGGNLGLLASSDPSDSGGNLDPTAGDIEDQLINGQEACPRGKYSFMTRVSHITEANYLCGGTLINSEWVVLAAQCITTFTPTDYILRIGVHNLNDTGDTPGAHISRGSRIWIHPNFNRQQRPLQNDIAMIRLETPVVYSRSSVRPACLPTRGFARPQPGRTVTLLGWGNQEEGESERSNRLREGRSQTVSIAECRRQGELFARVQDSAICAFSQQGTRMCQGDPGGPLLTGDGSRDPLTLIGVLSFTADGCAASPSVSTNVATSLPEILRQASTGIFCPRIGPLRTSVQEQANELAAIAMAESLEEDFIQFEEVDTNSDDTEAEELEANETADDVGSSELSEALAALQIEEAALAEMDANDQGDSLEGFVGDGLENFEDILQDPLEDSDFQGLSFMNLE